MRALKSALAIVLWGLMPGIVLFVMYDVFVLLCRLIVLVGTISKGFPGGW